MESNLPTKLQQFSADPPEEVWSRIADALAAEDAFPQRLFHYEELPPAGTWQTIAKGLEEPAKTQAPFFKRFRTPLRYAAVASFIAVVLVTVTLSVKRTEAGALEPGSKTTVPEKVSPKQGNVPQALTQQVPEESSAAPQKTSPSSSAQETTGAMASTQNSDSTNPETLSASFSSLNNYVFFHDGDGTMRKVSKKLAGMVNCKDNDIACQERLQALRQKLAASAMTTDFTGILEMLRQLQQKP